jgi:hypothetical protein
MVLNMPKTKKFKKMLKHMQKEYGKEKGERIAYATAKKRGWRT